MMLPGAPRAPVGLLFQVRRDTVLPEFDYSRLVVRVPRRRIDRRTRIILERYRYFMMRRAEALVIAGRGDRVEPLLDWYQSLSVSRLAPLPQRR
jgi:hypothetical protein